MNNKYFKELNDQQTQTIIGGNGARFEDTDSDGINDTLFVTPSSKAIQAITATGNYPNDRDDDCLIFDLTLGGVDP